MTSDEWLALFAERLGLEAPDLDVATTLLDLAAVAAHNSERIAAPLTCWMIGVGGVDPDQALAVARSLADEAAPAEGGAEAGAAGSNT